MSSDLAGKICLITGASSGIGFATALELAKMGATVALVCRDRERGEKAKAEILQVSENTNAELMLCDLSSPKQIRSLAAEYKSRHGRLHVLVNDAAVVPAKRTLTEDGLEMQFTVNHLAYFLLTNLLLDTLIASAPSRIVNVTSGMHKTAALDFDNLQGKKTYKAMKHYSLTKLLNISFTYELARRLEGTSVTVNCLAPGFTATELGRDFSAFSRFVMKTMGKKKEEGARTVVYLASSPDVATVTGKYFEKGKESRSSEETYALEIARRLWDLSEKMTRSA